MMKTLYILVLFFVMSGCYIPQQKNDPKIKSRKTIEKKIVEIRSNNKYGFDSTKNAQVYRLLDYPNVGFKDTINHLHFELFAKKDLGGAYNKGISWFVIVNEFSETEENWKTIENWSNSFQYDMTAHNEIFFLSKRIQIDESKDRTELIMSFFQNKKAQKLIIALREVNEERNTFEKFPFK